MEIHEKLLGTHPLEGRSKRAALIVSLFNWSDTVDKKYIFAAVAKVDRFYAQVNLSVYGTGDNKLTALVALAITVRDSGGQPAEGVESHLRQRYKDYQISSRAYELRNGLGTDVLNLTYFLEHIEVLRRLLWKNV